MPKPPTSLPVNANRDASNSAIENEILGEIAKAREKWGETFELKLLLRNWGDTFDDERMLEAIRNFRRTGLYLANVAKLTEMAREEFGRADGNCREVVVMPPIGPAFEDPERLTAIRARLVDHFPQFTWSVETGPIRDDVAFVLIPKLVSAGGGLLRAPPLEVIRAIGEFLNDNFAPNRRLH